MRCGWALAVAAAVAALPGHAARPLITDDARLTEAKSCQLEAWVTWYESSTEYWALPACNPTGAFEIAAGGARFRENGESFSAGVAQVKTLARPLEANGWGLGFSVGVSRHDPYANVPVSFSFLDDKWVAHVNAGALRRRDLDRTIVTWGFGHEIQLRENAWLLAEIFASDRGRPFYQAGLRYVLVKDRVQMDATYGNRAVSETTERWISVGVRLLAPPLFP